MANIKFKNLASSTLQSAITALATTVTVHTDDVAKFPVITGNEYFIVVAVNSAGDFEIMRVTAVVGSAFTVIRAQEGTAAKAFVTGDKIEHRLTAESLVTIVEEASVTKPHTSTDGATYGQASSTVFSHVKLTDDPASSASSALGVAITPVAVKNRFDQLLGAGTQAVITESGPYVVPESGTYEITTIGGGGPGGRGQDGYFTQNCNSYGIINGDSNNGGLGGAGGGAGQALVTRVTLAKDTSVAVIIGAGTGGSTSFGAHANALGGGTGGVGSAVGTSYGSLATAGAAGGYCECANADNQWRAMGGAGGRGGVSLEGTYGNGGNGGTGGSCGFTWSDAPQITPGSTGTSGTQGCVKIRLVLGS